ncbi:MAG TPA: hypothetical protein VF064_03105 [Pyrinomonadaceae bacterium]
MRNTENTIKLVAGSPRKRARTTLTAVAVVGLLLALACAPALAQNASASGPPPARAEAKARKLPSPEKIVRDYLKAAGGKKRLGAIRDAVYEWEAEGTTGGGAGRRVLFKAPSSRRVEVLAGDGVESVSAANARTAWRQARGAAVETLTGAEAQTNKLLAVLEGGRLVGYERVKAMARTAGVAQVGDEQAYAVEFSTRDGGRTRYWFGAASKLLLRVEDAAGGATVTASDFRPVGGVLEAHRVTEEREGKVVGSYVLRAVRHNTGLADALFEPPSDAALDIAALLRELAGNQDEVDQRVNDYTYTRRVTERELNDRGEVRKEKTNVYEVYPVVGWGRVQKLVSENGVALSPERAAKEEKRVAEELEKAEREAPKREAERRRKRAARAAKKARAGGDAVDDDADDDVGIATFLRACELTGARRERFRERETVVFDFRPRAAFRARNRAESIVSKLAGTIWVDPTDRQVMRLEARFVDGFKLGGGLAAVKSGSAFVFEQTRLADGVWLPRSAQVNVSVRLLFIGKSVNETHEFSDYKRFSARTGEDKLDAPQKP